MSDKTLDEIQASIEQLDLSDQLRLLQFLTPKIARAALATRASSSESLIDDAWRRYRALGDQLAATSVAGKPSLTDAVCQMRR